MMLGLPIIARGHRPFGYVRSEESDLFLPDETQFAALMKAQSYLKEGYSYETVAHWLFTTTGRSITAPGLCKLMKARPPSEELYEPVEYRENLTANLPYWKNEAQETRTKIATIARKAAEKPASKERTEEEARQQRRLYRKLIRDRKARILARQSRLIEVSVPSTSCN